MGRDLRFCNMINDGHTFKLVVCFCHQIKIAKRDKGTRNAAVYLNISFDLDILLFLYLLAHEQQ